MDTILMMSAKMATLGLLNMKLFQNKDYDVIVSDVISKILSGGLHCRSSPKFGNSTISMREAIITLIL